MDSLPLSNKLADSPTRLYLTLIINVSQFVVELNSSYLLSSSPKGFSRFKISLNLKKGFRPFVVHKHQETFNRVLLQVDSLKATGNS